MRRGKGRERREMSGRGCRSGAWLSVRDGWILGSGVVAVGFDGNEDVTMGERAEYLCWVGGHDVVGRHCGVSDADEIVFAMVFFVVSSTCLSSRLCCEAARSTQRWISM